MSLETSQPKAIIKIENLRLTQDGVSHFARIEVGKGKFTLVINPAKKYISLISDQNRSQEFIQTSGFKGDILDFAVMVVEREKGILLESIHHNISGIGDNV